MINIEVLREYVEAGDRIGYWTALDEMGDPYGGLARGVALNDSIAGATANGFFLRVALDQREGDGITPEQLADVSHRLMVRDFALRQDEADGILDSRQIQDYHEAVFREKGVTIEGWTAYAPLEVLGDGFPAEREEVWEQMLTEGSFWNTAANFDIYGSMIGVSLGLPIITEDIGERVLASEWIGTISWPIDEFLAGTGSQSGEYGSYEYTFVNPIDPSQTTTVIGGSENGDVIEGYDTPDPDAPVDPDAPAEPSGNDILIGFAGDDVLIATSGTDRLYGGEGSDDFVVTAGVGTTIILDAEPHDRLMLRFDPDDLREVIDDVSSNWSVGGTVIGQGIGEREAIRIANDNSSHGTWYYETVGEDGYPFYGSDSLLPELGITWDVYSDDDPGDYSLGEPSQPDWYYYQGTIHGSYFELDFFYTSWNDRSEWPEVEGFTLNGDELIVTTRYDFLNEDQEGIVIIDGWQEFDLGFGDGQEEGTRAAALEATAGGQITVYPSPDDFTDDGDPISATLNNVLIGTEGDDVLFGTNGDDTIIGLGGADRYAWTPGDGSDVIVEDTRASDQTEVLLAELTMADVRIERTGGEFNALAIAPVAVDDGSAPADNQNSLFVVAANAPSTVDNHNETTALDSSLGGQVVRLRLEDVTYHAVMDRSGSFVLTDPNEDRVSVSYPDSNLPAVLAIDGRDDSGTIGASGIRWAPDGESLLAGQGDVKAIVGSLSTRSAEDEPAADTGDAFLLVAFAGGERVFLAHDGSRAVVIDAEAAGTLVAATNADGEASETDWVLRLDDGGSAEQQSTLVTDLSIETLPYEEGATEASVAVRLPDGNMLALVSEPIGDVESVGNASPMLTVEDVNGGMRQLVDLGGSYLWADPQVVANLQDVEEGAGAPTLVVPVGPEDAASSSPTSVSVEIVPSEDGHEASITVDGNVVGTLLNTTTEAGTVLSVQLVPIAAFSDPSFVPDPEARIELTTVDYAISDLTAEVTFDDESGTGGDGGSTGGVEPNVEVREDADDSKARDTKTTTFDEAGTRTGVETVFDNGDTNVETFVDGARFASLFTDASETRDWLTQSTLFDADGDKTSTTLLYDDGNARTTLFEGGERLSSTIEDTAGTKAWQSVATRYDDNGDTLVKVTVNDNGTVRTVEYEDGVRSISTVEDIDDVKPWATNTIEFDDVRTRSQQTVVFDDGDVRTNLFEDGAKVTSVFEDVSDTRDWTSRTQTFDVDGNVSGTEYVWDDPLVV